MSDMFPIDLLVTGASAVLFGVVAFLLVAQTRARSRERQQANLALAASEERLRHSQRLQTIGQLSTGVAHEFNNLLTVIRGHSETLRKSADVSEEHRESARQIAEATDRASATVRQLLAFSRRQVVNKQVLDLNRFTSAFKDVLRRMVDERVAIELDLDVTPARVEADANMLEQLFLNLALNARDAMSESEESTLLIRTSRKHLLASQEKGSTRSGDYVLLTFRDTGCGIAPEAMDKLFEPFYTTKSADESPGMGLPTVQGIVEQHDGWIEVDSRPGEGAEFTVFLPESKKRPHLAPTPDAGQTPAHSGDRRTVLVLEDAEEVRAMIEWLLSKEGWEVLAVPSALHALPLWHDHRGKIDLIITDVFLPGGMSGCQFVERVRKDKPGVAAVFISGYSRDYLGLETVFREGDVFLAKPFSPQQLNSAMSVVQPAKAKRQSQRIAIRD